MVAERYCTEVPYCNMAVPRIRVMWVSSSAWEFSQIELAQCVPGNNHFADKPVREHELLKMRLEYN